MFGISGVLSTIHAGHYLFAPAIAPAGFADTRTLWTEFTIEWQIKEKGKARHPFGNDAA